MNRVVADTLLYLCLMVVGGGGQSIDSLIRDAYSDANQDGTDVSDVLAYSITGSDKKFVIAQMDMVLPEDEWEAILNGNIWDGTAGREASQLRDRLWKDGKVLYEIIKSDFSYSEQQTIVDAMLAWTTYTCVKFKQAPKEYNNLSKVRFIAGNRCSAHVGHTPGLTMMIRLAPRCMTKKILIHLIGHALGLYHEQMRHNRDDYLKIQLDNVRDGSREIQAKLPPHVGGGDSVTYDYASIMHFGHSFLSKSEDLCTLAPIDDTYFDAIGNASGLSFLDVKRVNLMYKCTDGCRHKPCPPQGFQGIGCKCWCPGVDGEPVVECAEDTIPKPGKCPAKSNLGGPGTCRPPCRYDNDCSGTMKCCQQDCGNRTCIEPEELCDPPCQNGGTCLEGNCCKCPDGTEGDRCQNVTSPECSPACENGGTCRVGNTCDCPEGFTGDRCEDTPDECSPACENGGTCRRGNICDCPEGFTGDRCEDTPDECSPACENGGTCRRGNTCDCPEGFTGDRCEDTLDECSPACENGGTCRRGNICDCPEGFTGGRCEDSPDECSPACENGSTCRRGNICDCPEGFTGDRCEDTLDEECFLSDVDASLFTVFTSDWDVLDLPSSTAFESGTVLIVECNTGDYNTYTNYTCSNGQWLGTFPTCKKECEVPEAWREDYIITAASKQDAEVTSVTSGEHVLLACKSDVSQKSVITCTDGDWDMQPEQCPPEQCTTPPLDFSLYRVFSSGRRVLRPYYKKLYNVGDTLLLACNNGLRTDIQCSDKGRWDTDLEAFCKSDRCAVPQVDRNAYIVVSEMGDEIPRQQTFASGGRVFIRCLDNPFSPPSPYLCSKSRWSGDLPDCTKTCLAPLLDDVKYALRTASGDVMTEVMRKREFVTDDEIQVVCRGKPNIPPETFKCEEGTWTGQLPDCTGLCSVPDYDTTAYIVDWVFNPGDVFESGAELNVSCIGNPFAHSTLFCNDTLWTGEYPDCSMCSEEEFRCGNGSCISQSQVCDGIPDCYPSQEDEAKLCGCAALDYDSGIYGTDWVIGPYDIFQPDDEIRVHCVGKSSIQSTFRCTNRDWNGTFPDCTSCADDEHTCNDGSCIPICQQCDGKADCPGLGDDELDCNFASCKLPNVSHDGIDVYSDSYERLQDGAVIEHGVTITAVCTEQGYDMYDMYDAYFSGTNLTCNHGNFLGDFPTGCKPVKECPPIPHANVTGGHALGFSVQCGAGYHLEPFHGRFFCHGGSWHPFHPTCHPNPCFVPKYDEGEVTNEDGLVLFGDTRVESGVTLTFSCPRGRVPDEVPLTCHLGTLEGLEQALPSCTLVTCPKPCVSRTSYFPLKESYMYKDVVAVSPCHGNLELVGSSKLECQADGTWSGEAECKKFCEGGQLRAITYQNVQVTNATDAVPVLGVSKISTCINRCARFTRFPCRSVTFGINEVEHRYECFLHSQTADVTPGLMTPRDWWRVAVLQCQE